MKGEKKIQEVTPNHCITITTLDSACKNDVKYTCYMKLPLTGSFGLTLVDDMDFGIPLLIPMHQTFPFKLWCKR